MLCGYPVSVNGTQVACGRCMNCRINKKREWVGKIILEQREYKSPSSFLTLSYNEENYPKDASLKKSHIQTFVKRLRAGPMGKLRYFAVGEYGTEKGRAHYHMILFGQPAQMYEEVVQRTWHDGSEDRKIMGFTKIDELTPGRAAYIAKYNTKKMTSPDDERLDGRTPEFMLCSKFPPLGAAGIERILTMLYSRAGAAALAKLGDVPKTFRAYGKQWPISKYWVQHMRDELGIDRPSKNPWEIDIAKITHQQQEQARQQADKRWRTKNRSNINSTF